jgi:hypothetical protein
VLVSARHVLSAAHCARGYDGKQTPRAFHLERDGRRHDVTLVETGDFHPDEGKMGDWMVLEATDIPADAPVASLATAAEMERVRHVGDSIADRSVPVWTITFPARGARIYPRRPPGRPWPFVSPGFVRSERAYREASLLTLLEGVVYDDSTSVSPPRLHVDVDSAWAEQTGQTLFQLHREYRADGDPIIYHSADYAPGSSGGGVFLGDTGHLLGIIPMGTSTVSRKDGYPGFGQLYRIDAICRASRVLGALPGCRVLVR